MKQSNKKNPSVRDATSHSLTDTAPGATAMRTSIDNAVRDIPDMNKVRAKQLIREWLQEAKPVNSKYRKLQSWGFVSDSDMFADGEY